MSGMLGDVMSKPKGFIPPSPKSFTPPSPPPRRGRQAEGVGRVARPKFDT